MTTRELTGGDPDCLSALPLTWQGETEQAGFERIAHEFRVADAAHCAAAGQGEQAIAVETDA